MDKRVLYTGIDLSAYGGGKNCFHLPYVSLHYRTLSAGDGKEIFEKIYRYTHLLFPTKFAVKSFFYFMRKWNVPKEYLDPVFILALGNSTKKALEEEGITINYIGSDETEEGMVRMLESIDLEGAELLIPQSGMHRPKLIHFLVEKEVSYKEIVLYDLQEERPETEIKLENFDEIVFSTPVAVRAFFDVHKDIPPSIDVHCMGLSTRKKLRDCLEIEKKLSV
ncbi:uroporphyrinogen-III synthase [bacterium]|nr:uroporphyrinogen-III synthase [bacterium]